MDKTKIDLFFRVYLIIGCSFLPFEMPSARPIIRPDTKVTIKSESKRPKQHLTHLNY